MRKSRPTVPRTPLALWFLFLALLIGLATGASTRSGDSPAAPIVVETGPAAEGYDTRMRWQEVEQLEKDDRFAAAAEIVEEILGTAIAAGDEDEWTSALVRSVQLRTALHGYETAVRFLDERPWPSSPRHRAILELFRAQGLMTYLQAYAWEIGQRERVEAEGELDLKRWTREQISAAAQEANLRVWRDRESWGGEGLGDLAEYLSQNNYPARIRGTWRDAVTYLWVELLADSSYWRPRHANEIHRLDRQVLIDRGRASRAELDLADPEVHPLLKIAALLDDLELWHRQGGRPEAAFEARLERLRRLHAALDVEADRALLRADLAASLEALGARYEWWSMGQAQLAEFIQQEEDADALIRARGVALAGEEAHPASLGGQRCRHVVAAIEAPHFDVTAMQSDGPDRRSLLVRHKNLEVVHFRAYRIDLLAHIGSSRDANLLPGYREIPDLMRRQLPVAEWSQPLPASEDFRVHRTFSTPAVDTPGLYVIIGSARRSFTERNNRLVAVNMVVGDLVLLTRNTADGFAVQVRSGRTGRALPGVEVLLYRFDYQRGHRRVASRTTDVDGEVMLQGPGRGHDRYFLVARSGDDLGLDAAALWRLQEVQHGERTASLIYTDRSVYRPRQTIHFKVVGYRLDGEGNGSILAGQAVTVELVDANHQVVDSRSVETNEFGSVAGEFEIPTGRLLGGWRLRSSLGGQTGLRVEEYKRPTFEVTIPAPAGALRLNRVARLTGEATYYFGLPVVEGEVTWRVERVPVLPRWWWHWRPPATNPEVIATGETSTDAEGRFEIEFLPQADERLAAEGGVSYNFRLLADVVDDGGETRSSARSFRLGFVAVEAAIERDVGFFDAGESVGMRIRRADLDGSPRSGRGGWSLSTLRQPSATLLPAEQPVSRFADADDRFRVPGDELRPRWDPGDAPEQIMRRWQPGHELAAAEVEHDTDGVATLELGPLAAGAYRLAYRTEDQFGALFETSEDFLVVEDGGKPTALPALLQVERSAVQVGEKARLLVQSGLVDQSLMLEIYRDGQRLRHESFDSATGMRVIEIPIGADDRGGFGVRLTAVRDHQLMTVEQTVFVPWRDRDLEVSFSSFRDLLRPGQRETWQVRVAAADGEALSAGAAELLAYMYDRSLDIFAPHQPPAVAALYPTRTAMGRLQVNLSGGGEVWSNTSGFASLPGYPHLRGDRLIFFDGYGIGGPGRRGRMAVLGMADAMAPMASREVEEEMAAKLEPVGGRPDAPAEPASAEASETPPKEALRSDFSETAFWYPHLLLAPDGSVAFEFTVPDSVTEWNVWVHAVSRDLRGGSLLEDVRTVKDLIVRPYLPRFLREGDRARLRVVVNNASAGELRGDLDFRVVDPESGTSLLDEFGLDRHAVEDVPFAVAAGGSTSLEFEILAPPRVGQVAVEVYGRAGDWSDGERRPLPLLPGRMHLSQSRFAALRDSDRRELHFADLAADDDPTRLHEQLVVTLDAQLFYGVLQALPYLARFPYECTEQTLNRFVSTGIVTSLYDSYPAVAAMAREFSERQTQFETWDAVDPNRKMALVETPWLRSAQGGERQRDELLNVLDPRIAEAERLAALAKLRKAQTSLGGFPWWPGGPPSPYMTLYLLQGFSRALEFGIEIPQDLVVRAWQYMHRHYVDELVHRMMDDDCCWEQVTFLNYVLSSYPDESWTGGVFSADDRQHMLDFSFRHWRRHSPLLKSSLALTLVRSGRDEDARRVFASVMDSARTTPDEGTFWAAEDRSWLWYNDTIETHAFALRTLTEIDPADERRHGLVHWLFLNKKLNHWKSTRATAEVIYSLVHYLDEEGQLGQREVARVEIGDRKEQFVFEPESYSGAGRQLVIAGDEIVPPASATVVVEKSTPGLMFASATWSFSTEELPAEARGDFFAVERSYFRRLATADGWVLRPLREGDTLEVGDQVEVQLSLRTRHAAEYVHLRDPRGAGFEPVSTDSRYKWDLGIGWYEEIRDSGTNFFFDWLPVGEYTFKYRLRVAMAGRFRVSPAVLQSMYAPEFTAYSSGAELTVGN